MLIRLLDMSVPAVVTRRSCDTAGAGDAATLIGNTVRMRMLSAINTLPEDHLMVLLKAYLDDSGAPHGGHTFMTIAGYVADVTGWTHFEQRWRPSLHGAEFLIFT
jgi:hypothetical protein